MSDIQITSTGKKFYRVDPTLAAVLQELFPEAVKPLATGAARPVHPANAASATIPSPAEPIWKIIKAETTGQICVQCDWLRTTMRFGGNPANVYKMVVGPHKIPTAVADEYVRLKLQETDPATRLEYEQALREREESALLNAGGATLPGKTL
jgi:hypothetical protein